MTTRTVRIELDVAAIAEILKAVADPTRQQILKLLEDKPRAVTEIVDHFSLSQPTISRHLSVLKNAGLVQAERHGQYVVYSLRPARLQSICHGFFGSFDCCATLFRHDREKERK
jgi:DNA-binding transcriptional ArsR family regulator